MIQCVFFNIVIPSSKVTHFFEKKCGYFFWKNVWQWPHATCGKERNYFVHLELFGVKNDDGNMAICRLVTSQFSLEVETYPIWAAICKTIMQRNMQLLAKQKSWKRRSKLKIPGRQKQVTLPVTIKQTQPYLSSSKWAQEITNALVHFIAKEMMPFNIIECLGFHKLLRKLDD